MLLFDGFLNSKNSNLFSSVAFRNARSESCPFCRDSLKRVNSGDLWMYMRSNEIDDLASINKENLKRLFMYIEKLPLVARPYIHMLSSHLVVAS
jgi:hypothetical protein